LLDLPAALGGIPPAPHTVSGRVRELAYGHNPAQTIKLC
jgi:hypothetical protein